MFSNNPELAELDGGDVSGLRIRLRTDFDGFYATAARRPGGHVPAPLYRDHPWPVAEGTAVWLDARDDTDRHVCSLVLRAIDTGDGTLSDFLMSHFAPCFGRGELVHRQPILDAARGPIVYQGDMWIAKDIQGDGIGVRLLEYGAALAWRIWRPNGVFGFFDRDPAEWPYARDSIYGQSGVIGRIGQNWGTWMEAGFWVGWVPASAISAIPLK